jgi:formyltetrahydrofolate synthetase
MADLGGLTSVLITPDMVGQTLGVDIQLEIKTRIGRATPEQAAYIATMQSLGARAGIARSVEDAARIIRGEKL